MPHAGTSTQVPRVSPGHGCCVPTGPLPCPLGAHQPFALCAVCASPPCWELTVSVTAICGGQSARLAPVRTSPFCCPGEKPWGCGAASQGWAAGSTPSSGRRPAPPARPQAAG